MAGSVEEKGLWLDKAGETLDAARVLLETAHYADSVSRSYYAMFYAAKAAVLSEGVDAKKHSSIISAFGRLFARTGRLDPAFHRTLARAFKGREVADYAVSARVLRAEAERQLAAARDFVGAIRSLLGS